MRRTFVYVLPLLALFFSYGQMSGEKSDARNRAETTRLMGADISFLPELEARGISFSVDGRQEDPIKILKDHGFNFIRLRIFVDPAADSGYSPGRGFCDLSHTLQMAQRIKAAGMGFLLDFHYSDTWADPGKQFKPAAWEDDDFSHLKKDIYDYTKKVVSALKDQGTVPDMVQIGNEINHGILWPDGNMSHPDTLAAFLKSGIKAVKSVDPSVKIMLHIAEGGQNEASRYFIDQMLQREVAFDIIGESYYPQWHGTPAELKSNLEDLSQRYTQPLMVVEYSEHKQEVNDIVFHLPGHQGLGTCIWEPLNTWEAIFDKNGAANDSLLDIYSEIKRKYAIEGWKSE